MSTDPTRRTSIGGRRTFALGLAAAAVLASCAPSGDTPTTDDPVDTDEDTDTPQCLLTPEQTAGPFYFDVEQVRSDIRERPHVASRQHSIPGDTELQPNPRLVADVVVHVLFARRYELDWPARPEREGEEQVVGCREWC